jgi:hypothetical protein
MNIRAWLQVGNIIFVFSFCALGLRAQDCDKASTKDVPVIHTGTENTQEYEGWRQYEIRNLSFKLPPEFVRADKKCIEGGCYDFVNADTVFSLDVSAAADRPSAEKKFPSFCEQFMWINETFAWIWHFEKPTEYRFVSGAFFSSREDTKLAVGAYLLSNKKSQRDIALKIFRSFRFRK